jgi:hypothetical protein
MIPDRWVSFDVFGFAGQIGKRKKTLNGREGGLDGVGRVQVAQPSVGGWDRSVPLALRNREMTDPSGYV